MNAQSNPEEEEIFFQSPNPMPVEIKKSLGFFHPTDKRTGEIQDDKIYKQESVIYDPSKHHPVFYQLFSQEPMVLGQYLATISLGYFNGKYESRLLYKKCDSKGFNNAIELQKENKSISWNTNLKVEIYRNEKIGSGFNHEAYLLDTIRKMPILMDCWQREKLQSGNYELSVSLDRRKGKIVPVNNYVFIEPLRDNQL